MLKMSINIYANFVLNFVKNIFSLFLTQIFIQICPYLGIKFKKKKKTK